MSENDLELDDEEQAALASLEGKMEHIRAALDGLNGKYHTGLFVWGEGGMGKSYTVLRHLQAMGAKHTVHNSRLSARGLVDALEAAPDDIHVIEDAETMFHDKKVAGVLRSALHSQSEEKPLKRIITWTTHQTQTRFVFTGSIVIISNLNLADQQPEIRALKTRISVLRLDVTNDELLALMKRTCADGFQFGNDRMTPTETWQVARYIRQELALLQRPIDLRLLINGFKDYLQWRNLEAGSLHWGDLVKGRIREGVHSDAVGRRERIARDRTLASELSRMNISTREKIERFMQNGHYKSYESAERAYYRRLHFG